MFAVILTAALLLLLAACCYTDITQRRVPNTLVLVGLVVAAALNTVAVFSASEPLTSWALLRPVLGALAGVVGLMPLYLVRACGAGDCKLMSAVGAFAGAGAVLPIVIYTLVAGGVLSLACMLVFGVWRQALANTHFLLTDWVVRLRTGGGARIATLATTAYRLPYVLAITGGVLYYLMKNGWRLAAA
jgi:prepilin peptidase CpaA